MSNIKYTIEFYSQWHCGSGLSAGADVDALVVKGKDDMPYVPGKTIKGLVREAVENLMQFTGADKSGLIEQAFGKEGETTGCAHFDNAKLDGDEYETIVKANAAQFLYNKVTTTAISDEGTAQEHSLRSIETVVPCTLYGEITGVPVSFGPVGPVGPSSGNSPPTAPGRRFCSLSPTAFSVLSVLLSFSLLSLLSG